MSSYGPGYRDDAVAELLEAFRRTGQERLRAEVIEQMRPLVRSIARKFAGKELVEDLESEGFLGLIRAVDRYQPDRGTRFSTFAAHLIAGQIRHYLRDRGHLIRQPAWLQELDTRVRRVSQKLEQQFHRPPTVAEIAAEANLTEEGVEELLSARQAARILSLSVAQGDDDLDLVVLDTEKFRSRDYVTFELPLEDRIVLENALGKLKELERRVVHAFFFQENNQSEIARKLGISCNYVGYVLRRGLKHLREAMNEEAPFPTTEPSSGLIEREQFQARLYQEIDRAGRHHLEVSLCALVFSPDCPEEAFREAGEEVRRRTRRYDVVGRLAPRELGVILPATGVVATQVAERLAAQVIPVVNGPVRAAAATYPVAGCSAEQLMDRLDNDRILVTAGRY